MMTDWDVNKNWVLLSGAATADKTQEKIKKKEKRVSFIGELLKERERERERDQQTHRY